MITTYSVVSILILLLLIANQKRYWRENKVIQLNWKREIALCLVAVGFSFSSIQLHENNSRGYRPLDIGVLSNGSHQLIFIDELMVGQWNIKAKKNGKIFKNIAIYILPISLLFFATSFKRRWAIFFVFTEGYVLTESLTGIVKGLVTRYRPFAYRTVSEIDKLSKYSRDKFMEDIYSYDIQNSFFSGDASITGFSFMFFGLCYSHFYSDSRLKTGVYVVVFFCILSECYFRALSGKHFPSDVIIGALSGSLVALMIFRVHQGEAFVISHK